MFEIEQMEKQFDYSLVDTETADFLRSCEYEMNGIAEDARVKFGKVLKNVQEKLSNYHDGVFVKWYESGGLDKNDVYYSINLYEISRNLENSKKSNFLNAPKTLQKEVMKKNAPKELKEKVFDGDITTNKEYQKEIDEWKKRAEQAQQQAEQAQKSEQIALRKLEDAENKEPEVIERYSEPDDYQEVKEKLKQAMAEKEEYRQQLSDWHMSHREREEKSRKYDELNEAIKEMDSKLSDGQLRFKNRKFVNDLVTQSRVLMKEVAPLTYSIESLHPDDLDKMKKSLNDLAGDLYKISKDIKEKIDEGIVVNE